MGYKILTQKFAVFLYISNALAEYKLQEKSKITTVAQFEYSRIILTTTVKYFHQENC